MATGWYNSEWADAVAALAHQEDTGNTEREQAITTVFQMASVHCQTSTDGMEAWIASSALFTTDNANVTPRMIAAEWDAGTDPRPVCPGCGNPGQLSVMSIVPAPTVKGVAVPILAIFFKEGDAKRFQAGMLSRFPYLDVSIRPHNDVFLLCIERTFNDGEPLTEQAIMMYRAWFLGYTDAMDDHVLTYSELVARSDDTVYTYFAAHADE